MNNFAGLRLLWVHRILQEETCDTQSLSASQIAQKLKEHGIEAERKSVYTDINSLKEFGIDIITTRRKGYSIGKRDFELPELKLLVDAVQSSRLITNRKSGDLIRKLAMLTSKEEGMQLQRLSTVVLRSKMANERVYYVVNTIYDAIIRRKKIVFQYFRYDRDKQQELRHGGDFYTNTPLALCWHNDNYYLIVYSKKHNALVNYRVDRMTNVSVIDEAADIVDMNTYRLSTISKRQFAMYGGDMIKVTMRFSNELANVVLDQFGMDIELVHDGDDHFLVATQVDVSPMFFGWIFSLKNQAEIVSPDSVRAQYAQMVDNAYDNIERP